MTCSPSSTASSDAANAVPFNIQGKIIRKKNISSEYLKLAIQQDNHEKSTTVYLPRNDISTIICTPPSSEVNFLYLDSIIHVKGYTTTTKNTTTNTDEEQDTMMTSYNHVTQCNLIKCSPNVKLIKELLALPNYTSFASTLCMNEDELQQLVNDEKSTQKIIVHTIIERITGKIAKAPPKYRPGRVKRSDMDILEQKEAEGRRGAETTKNNLAAWQLCQPCQSMTNNTITKKKKEPSVINLPTGSEDLLSAHGKLTRYEYLETKKNNQSVWFIERIKQFDITNELQHTEEVDDQHEQRTIRFLDVGGGRGDLAVQIALNFSNAIVIVVDCNANSIKAGEEYAMKCGVKDRIEFHCMNFTEYITQYHGSSNGGCIDFVVALHACGDLSDMALNFAHTFETNFIIVPCCYPKRYLQPYFTPYWHGLCKNDNEIDSLSRLVELDDHRDVSRRAMLVINSMRQSEFIIDKKKTKNVHDVTLEEFDCKISKRNIALVGRKSTNFGGK